MVGWCIVKLRGEVNVRGLGDGVTWDGCVSAVKEAVMGNGGCSARVRQTGFVRDGIDPSVHETLFSCGVPGIHWLD